MDTTKRPSIFRRLAAMAIDMVMLSLVGLLSGIFLKDFYVSLAIYGTLFGSTIVVLYFSVFQSSIGRGQTIGKKLMGIKVTDINGQYLSMGKSVLRSSMLFYPIMNIEMFSGGGAMIVVLLLVILFVFASIYLALVNKSRRSLHDILATSVVTREMVGGFEINEPNDRSVKKLIPIVVIAVVIIGLCVFQMFAENDISRALSARAKIADLPGVIGVNEIRFGTTTHYSTSGPTETYPTFSVTVRLDDDVDDSDVNERYFKDIRRIVNAEIPGSENLGVISMSLFYGYDIGIASNKKTVTQTFKK